MKELPDFVLIVALVPASQSASPAKFEILSVKESSKLAVLAKPVLETTEFGEVSICFLDRIPDAL